MKDDGTLDRAGLPREPRKRKPVFDPKLTPGWWRINNEDELTTFNLIESVEEFAEQLDALGGFVWTAQEVTDDKVANLGRLLVGRAKELRGLMSLWREVE